MRVLITGGTGFIGSRTASMASARGHDVTLLSRGAVSPSERPVIQCDLTRPDGLAERIAGFDAVIHCAAALSGSEADRRATVDGTRNLIASMDAARVKRIVLVSSFAVYDFEALSAGAVLTEDSPIDKDGGARGAYIDAKREQERLVVTGRSDLEWTVLRPGIVFGPGRTWHYDIGARLPGAWVTLAGSATLPLTYVDNCAEAIAAALDAPGARAAVINVVDTDLPTRTQYVDWLAEAERPRPRVVDVPWSLLHTASRAAWAVTHHVFRDVFSPPGSLHPAVLAARCKPLRYDNDRARRLLGWEPRITIRDGLRASLDRRSP